MDRDEAALLLVVLGSGALLWFVGALTPPAATGDEQSAWRRVWLPAIPAATLFFVFVGFAVADPEGPQAIHATRLVATVPFAVVWARALARAARASFAEGGGPAWTEGLVRPTVRLSSELRARLEPGELRAVIAHEDAHARHRDPLRLWLVQLLTDLQWPLTAPRRRQQSWQRALELARDDEAARHPDVDPADLASALVKTASLVRPARAAGASLADDATLLETRVRRLLTAETTVQRERSASSWTRVALALTLTVGAFVFGFVASAPFVSLLAGSP
ncbi:MAG: M56 family metallopeptidase [Myxococcales bacterium]|nr:M56 family metallopeptidase [Myxococcales bacterium]